MDASLRELRRILEWLDQEGLDGPVLIGGWAVQVYNMWYGSIDIDLVMTSNTRGKLHQHLRSRGYGAGGLFEDEGFGLNHRAGRIIIETFSREHPRPFESRREHRLDFAVLDEPGRTVPGNIDDVQTQVPSREVLLAFKLKAAWDRTQRLEQERSPNPEYEHGKVIKDHADVLALLDPEEGGHEIDLTWMAQLYTDHPFLIETTREVYRRLDGVEHYGTSPDQAEDWVETMLDLVGAGDAQ